MPKVVEPEERREEIARAAYRTIARDGLEGLKMREVAAEAEATIGLVNHWFAGKDELIRAALEYAANNQIGAMRTALRDNPDDLAAALQAVLPLSQERHADYRVWLAFWVLSLSRPELKAVQQSYSEGFYAQVASLLKRVHGMPARLAADMAHLLGAVVDGIAIQAMVDGERWTPQQQKRIFKLLWQLLIGAGQAPDAG